MMYALLALVSAIIAGSSFYYFQRYENMLSLILAVVFVILTVIFGIIFMSSRVNKTEDIHITE